MPFILAPAQWLDLRVAESRSLNTGFDAKRCCAIQNCEQFSDGVKRGVRVSQQPPGGP